MADYDLINAMCKQCGGAVSFKSCGMAPSGMSFDIEDAGIPASVIEGADHSIAVCPTCRTGLQFVSSVSAWVRIVTEPPKR